MIINTWEHNIEENLRIVSENCGPSLFIAVTGNEADRNYWQDHFENLRGELFRRDRSTIIFSITETVKKGNFLGTLNAWLKTKQLLFSTGRDLPNIALMNMIFGQGKRLSPFTQALANRKPAFPLPYNSKGNGFFLCTADLSCLYTNLWIDQLFRKKFKGLVVKWGDEAVIPGRILSDELSFAGAEGVRFIWKRDLTEELARDKEWVLVDDATRLVKKQFARSTFENLRESLLGLPASVYQLGVNLGSLAISYDFLDIAGEVFREDIADVTKWVDWDPYVWIAFHCRSEDEWFDILEQEKRLGPSKLNELVKRYPDLFEKVSEVKRILKGKSNREFSIYAFDFGEPYWADFGLHHSLRRQLESVLDNSDTGVVSRKMFNIPEDTDEKGNRIIRSVIPPEADIRDSVILDSVITDSSAKIRNGLVVGGMHGKIKMLQGGSALFCAVKDLEFKGPHGVAFGLVGQFFSVPEGGRHTTLPMDGYTKHLSGHESIVDMSGDNYEKTILGNAISYAEAEKLMSQVNPKDIELMREKIRKYGWEILNR